MSEVQPDQNQEIVLEAATQGFLDSIPVLKIDPEIQDTSLGSVREVTRLMFTPIALQLVGIGHQFGAETHTPEALVQEVLKRRDAFGLSDELVFALQERYTKEVDWHQEGLAMCDLEIPNPLRELSEVMKQHLGHDAQRVMAKISF